VKRLAERFELPVTTTLWAKGFLRRTPSPWPGHAGMHGTATPTSAVTSATLLIAAGARFDEPLPRPDRTVLRLAPGDPHARSNAAESREGATSRGCRSSSERALALESLVWQASAMNRPLQTHQGPAGEIESWETALPPDVPEEKGAPSPPQEVSISLRQLHRRRSSPPMSASTRCGRPSTFKQNPAAPIDQQRRSGHDGLACRLPFACRWPIPA